MKIRIGKSKVIVLILICAIFNDILRIQGTKISFFRLLLPVAIFFILSHIHLCVYYVLTILGLLILSVLQYLNADYKYSMEFDLLVMLTYWLLYSCVIIIFALIKILYVSNKKELIYFFNNIIPLIGIISMVIYLIKLSIGSSLIANINDWGCCLNIIFPLYMIKAINGKRFYGLLCILIVAELWLGDSKTSLCGVFIEILIIMSMKLRELKYYGKLFMPFFLMASVCVTYSIVNSSITINGYSIKEMFYYMVDHIMTLTVPAEMLSSIGYRTSSIVLLLIFWKENLIVGIGPGNSTRILGMHMLQAGAERHVKRLSPHISILEFLVEGGIWALVVLFFLFRAGVRNMYNENSDTNIYSAAVIISFFFWNMGASEIYTIYLVFIIIGIIIFMWKNDSESLNF